MTWSTVDEAVIARGHELVANGETPEEAAIILRAQGCKISGRTLRRRLAAAPAAAPDPVPDPAAEPEAVVARAADAFAARVLAELPTLPAADAALVSGLVARLRGGRAETVAAALAELAPADVVLLGDVVGRLLGREAADRELGWVVDVLRQDAAARIL